MERLTQQANSTAEGIQQARTLDPSISLFAPQDNDGNYPLAKRNEKKESNKRERDSFSWTSTRQLVMKMSYEVTEFKTFISPVPKSAKG